MTDRRRRRHRRPRRRPPATVLSRSTTSTPTTATSTPSRASTSTSAAARSSPCSAPTAPARRRRCARSAACSTPAQGTVELEGTRHHQGRARTSSCSRGIGHAPEGRRIFSRLTMLENLQMGGYTRTNGRDQGGRGARLRAVPAAAGARTPEGRHAVGRRAADARDRAGADDAPAVLLLDEPSLGLAPILVQQIFKIIQEINAQGMTILLVEQNALQALSIANRGYVLQTGRGRPVRRLAGPHASTRPSARPTSARTDAGPRAQADDRTRTAARPARPGAAGTRRRAAQRSRPGSRVAPRCRRVLPTPLTISGPIDLAPREEALIESAVTGVGTRGRGPVIVTGPPSAHSCSACSGRGTCWHAQPTLAVATPGARRGVTRPTGRPSMASRPRPAQPTAPPVAAGSDHVRAALAMALIPDRGLDRPPGARLEGRRGGQAQVRPTRRSR